MAGKLSGASLKLCGHGKNDMPVAEKSTVYITLGRAKCSNDANGG